MNGLIALWKQNVYLKTNGTYSYYVPSLKNWYVCDGSQIDSNFTTPNLVGYIPVGATSTDIVNISGGTVSISESIPTSNHTHLIDISGATNILHNITISTSIDVNEGAFTTNQYPYKIISSTIGHTHTTDLYTGTTTVQFAYTTSSSINNSKLNYVSQYFIIYYNPTLLISSITLFKGMIYHWNGNITLNGSYYQPCDSSSTVYDNWYVCNDINNGLNSNIPSFDNRIAVILTSGSNYSSDNNSIRDIINIGSHTHTIDISSVEATIGTVHNSTTYNTLSSIDLDKYSSIEIGNLAGGTTINGIVSDHSHNIINEYSNLDIQVSTSETFSNPILKYMNLYYIIYLPNLS